MIGLDTNILIYAHRAEMPEHARCWSIVTVLAEAREPWLIPFHCLVEFYGTVTKPNLFKTPTTRREAVEQIEIWMESPSLVVGVPRESYWRRLKQLIESAQVTGAFIHDAHVAAICLDYGVSELWSNDAQMLRFREVNVRNPLN